MIMSHSRYSAGNDRSQEMLVPVRVDVWVSYNNTVSVDKSLGSSGKDSGFTLPSLSTPDAG